MGTGEKGFCRCEKLFTTPSIHVMKNLFAAEARDHDEFGASFNYSI